MSRLIINGIPTDIGATQAVVGNAIKKMIRANPVTARRVSNRILRDTGGGEDVGGTWGVLEVHGKYFVEDNLEASRGLGT